MDWYVVDKKYVDYLTQFDYRVGYVESRSDGRWQHRPLQNCEMSRYKWIDTNQGDMTK